ncbi:MAG: hypothetical protein EPN43_13800 [Jatrophihabitans sp.]|nr:MAG: hypothetical protein EPN43_13800 [Jatrophihabitans sp.]
MRATERTPAASRALPTAATVAGPARVARPGRPLTPAALLQVQRTVGNRAATAMIGPRRDRCLGGRAHPRPRAPVVQRHASFEHTLLGNTPPGQLSNAAVDRSARSHLLFELARQANFFSGDALADPRTAFPDVRWVKLRGSGLWLSYGELSSMADYLPADVDDLPRDVVEPVVQRMRRLSAAQCFKMYGLYGESPFAGEAESGVYEFSESVGIEKAMDSATASLGADRYFGMVERNACHFAPESWHRWARFHEEAGDHALAFHRGKHEQVALDSVDTTQDENLRQAWLKNGYGDHFLQDSFAAGHLINKTLVMQWFVDYVNGLSSKWWDLIGRMWWGDDTKPWYGMPDDDVMSSMGTAAQPNLAGQGLYHPPLSAGTPAMDAMLGDTPTDPQTAWERDSHEGRVAGSGVVATPGRTREQNYQAYLKFLNSSFLQLAAGETHDYLNKRGLTVVNDRGDRMTVGGDNTLLTESGALGARVAAEAAQASHQAIEDLIGTGVTDRTVDKIAALWPTQVWVGGEGGHGVPLQDWHEDVLHDLCRTQIFPGVVDSFNSKVARAAQPGLVDGGLRDPATPPPPLPDNLGDFVTPRGDPMG